MGPSVTLQIGEYPVRIDSCTAPMIQMHSWCIAHVSSGHPYFKTSKGIYLHRFLMGCIKGDGRIIDHINGDTLDNRLMNLRCVSSVGNNINRRKGAGTSKYKGVSWNKEKGRWVVQIKVGALRMYIGSSKTELEAARLYDLYALYYFKGYAVLNFPESRDLYVIELSGRPPNNLNAKNTSGYRGVSWSAKRRMWRAQATVQGVNHTMGYYDDIEEAAKAYDNFIDIHALKRKKNFHIGGSI